jgi:1,2-diacylglycerol 3-alpha-glucosyltransferase
MDSLKIIQVTHTYPPYVGGLSHVVEMLSKQFVKQGHEVEVVTLDPSLKLKASEETNGVSIKRFPCLAPYNSYFFPAPRLASYLRQLKGDILHVHNIGALLVPFSWLATEGSPTRPPFVMSPHHHAAGSSWHTAMFWKPYKPIAKHVIQNADAIHCVSEFEAEVVQSDFEVTPITVHNGVDDDVFSFRWTPPASELILTYAGRLEKYKQVDLVIKAAENLKAKGHDAILRIIGGGPELPNIQKQAQLANIPLEHYDFLPRQEYLKLLATSSCFVNLSLYEAFSIVVAEAIGIGLPVAAALPWGKTFENYPKVALIKDNTASTIADEILKVTNAPTKSCNAVLSWKHASKQILEEIYVPALTRNCY